MQRSTKVNGDRIRPKTKVSLENGSRLMFGASTREYVITFPGAESSRKEMSRGGSNRSRERSPRRAQRDRDSGRSRSRSPRRGRRDDRDDRDDRHWNRDTNKDRSNARHDRDRSHRDRDYDRRNR